MGWLAGPDSTPIGSDSWTPVDLERDGTYEYAYVSDGAVRILDPVTGADSALWEIPYDKILQASFWGRTSSWTPLVYIITSDGRSGEEPPSTRHAHELLTGARLSSISGSAMSQHVLSGYLEAEAPVLAAEVGYRFSDYSTPGYSYLHEWRGFDLFDLQGMHLDRLVFWTYDGHLEPYVWAPALIYVQIVRVPESGASIALRFYRDNIFGTQGWWLQRLISSSGGYELIRHWDAPASSAVAFDLLGDGQRCWLFPLAIPGWERRSLLDAAIIDSVPGPANAQLRVGPLVVPEKADLFYIADSTLYIYRPDIHTGVFDDPESEAPSTDLVTLTAHPNPFNSAVTLSWSTAAPVPSLTIYNILGQPVVELMLDGKTEVTWNGCDSELHQCPSGIYIARLTSPGLTASTKVVLLR